MSRAHQGNPAAGSPPMDIGALVGMLADRAEVLARELAPDGVRRGPEWVALNPTRGDRHAGSFSICVSGARAGVWADFAEGAGGDALDLVAYVKCGGDKKAAVRWARSWLGLDGADPATFEKARVLAAARADERRAKDAAERKRRNDRALALWLSAQAELRGTPADHYLQGRGVDLALLGRQPRALRFHPDCFNGQLQRRFPALLALIQGFDGKTMGVHRTFLVEAADAATGELTWRHIGKVLRWPEDADPKVAGKAVDGKLVLGDQKGGFVALWRGASGKPLRAAPAGDHAVITEGQEKGLAAALARPERRVLSALNVANMAAVVAGLPAAIGDVTLVVDNEPKPNPDTEKAVKAAIAAGQRTGRRVWLSRSPVGKDFNDALEAAG